MLEGSPHRLDGEGWRRALTLTATEPTLIIADMHLLPTPRPSPVVCRTSLAVLALLGLMIPHASAGGRKNIKEQSYNQTSDVIESVDAKAHTVTIAKVSKKVVTHEGTGKDSGSKDDEPRTISTTTYKVTDRTEIEVSGQKNTLDALQKGMKVDVTKGMNEDTAARLSATP